MVCKQQQTVIRNKHETDDMEKLSTQIHGLQKNSMEMLRNSKYVMNDTGKVYNPHKSLWK